LRFIAFFRVIAFYSSPKIWVGACAHIKNSICSAY